MNDHLLQYLPEAQADALERIRAAAHQAHEAVNQFYDGVLPYGYHLDCVAHLAQTYGVEVCQNSHDVLPIMFGAWFHDAIEDARLSYNDVRRLAGQLGLNAPQALLGAEIVFALTNDKGRTRSERAGENYYKGIRQTPYAPMVKLADRAANVQYSAQHANPANRHMMQVYKEEMPHFLSSLRADTDDLRFALPKGLLALLGGFFDEEIRKTIKSLHSSK